MARILKGWRSGCLFMLAFGFVATGIHFADAISLKSIGLNYAALRGQVDAHPHLAMVTYVGVYGLLGICMLPGSAAIVVLSGLLFGTTVGIPLALVGSVLAASLPFFAAKLIFANSARHLTVPILDRFSAGFHRHALSYMLCLRLTPGVPFSVVNIAPALLGVSFTTFLSGTIAGLIPSRIILSTAGAGLANAIDVQNALYSQCLAIGPDGSTACVYGIDFSSLLTRQTVTAFVALAVLAMVPIVVNSAVEAGRRRSTKC
jgi:uncharacterized membrane protein YdjX (TVP38/TMEM64 family)